MYARCRYTGDFIAETPDITSPETHESTQQFCKAVRGLINMRDLYSPSNIAHNHNPYSLFPPLKNLIITSATAKLKTEKT